MSDVKEKLSSLSELFPKETDVPIKLIFRFRSWMVSITSISFANLGGSGSTPFKVEQKRNYDLLQSKFHWKLNPLAARLSMNECRGSKLSRFRRQSQSHTCGYLLHQFGIQSRETLQLHLTSNRRQRG